MSERNRIEWFEETPLRSLGRLILAGREVGLVTVFAVDERGGERWKWVHDGTFSERFDEREDAKEAAEDELT